MRQLEVQLENYPWIEFAGWYAIPPAEGRWAYDVPRSHTVTLFGMTELQGSLEQYLRFLWQATGTDLHLSVGVPAMGRIDGDLRPIAAESFVDEGEMQTILAQVLTADQMARYERDLDVDFAL